MMASSGELKTSAVSPLPLRLCRVKRLCRRVLALAVRLEGGQFRSATLRQIFARFHDMEIEAHSCGSCFEPGHFPGGARVGQSVIFTESCTRVGISAGTIATGDVEDFEITVGNPGRVLRKPFDPELRARILASRWWERPVEELAGFVADLNLPVSGWHEGHTLLAAVTKRREPA